MGDEEFPPVDQTALSSSFKRHSRTLGHLGILFPEAENWTDAPIRTDDHAECATTFRPALSEAGVARRDHPPIATPGQDARLKRHSRTLGQATPLLLKGGRSGTNMAADSWLDMLAARLRTEGFECFVPHEHFPELADVTVEQVYRIDTEGLRSANALVAWLDGAMVDDGTACEIGMFAELVRSESERYRGIVAIATDLRLERRRTQGVVGGGMNLFVGGAIESCGKIVRTVDEVVAALREL